MSRFNEWSNALNGISNIIKKAGHKVNNGNYKIESKFINDYSRINNLKGSFSERVLLISNNFKNFREHIYRL